MKKIFINILLLLLGIGLTILGFITWEGIFLLPGIGILVYYIFDIVKYLLKNNKENKEVKEE